MWKICLPKQSLLVLSFFLFLSCAPDNHSSSSNPKTENENSKLKPKPGFGICSYLDFMGFNWPDNMFDYEKEGLTLALNITGSFEGPHGWKNLTNDFDGQGISMGLMNQNLGTGSLQPLLVKMRQNHFSKFQSLFRPDHFHSLLAMLSQWESTRVSQQADEIIPSPLDIDSEASINSSTSGSVDWARKTVYDSSGVFNPIWKQELLNLAGSPEYVSLQIAAAWELHLRSLKLHQKIAVYELRTYLLMFDIVVQNGNLKPQDEIDYFDYLNQNPNASATQRLEKIVELRLRWVKPQFRNDVRNRKLSLVRGSGRVHGVNREFEKEYCFYNRRAFHLRPTLP